MTRREIQRLAQRLHATGPYYQLAFRDQPARLQSSTVAQRVDLACADPAFGWHVAESYARAALALPDAPWPSAVQRAHAALRDPNCYDVSVRMVEQLNQPEKKTRRDLLRPLLVCADNSLEQLADLCRVSLDIIGLFEALTWNCRDRCRERIYLARICQVPGFAQNTGWLQESEDLGCNLLRIAYRLGRTQAVLSAAGLAPTHAHGTSDETLQKQILDTILAHVLDRLKAEKVSKADNPLLGPILSILVGRQKSMAVQQTLVQRLSPPEAIKVSFQWALAEGQSTQIGSVAFPSQPNDS